MLSAETITGIVATVVFLFLLIFSFRIATGFGAMITLFAAIMSLVVLFRTGNPFYFVAVLFQLFATLLLIMIAVLDIVEYKTWFIVTAALMVVFMTLLIIFSLQKRMKWRTREVLELAAMPVKDVKNGFTQRPKQVGRADYSDQELKDFARFIRRNMIAVPIHEPSRIVFVVNIPFKRLMLFKHQYEDRSWISFDDSGNVTASISQEDYMLYRDQFAFDQLCDSLGRLFIGFYEDYNAGRGQKVIDSFNKMNLNIITEG